MVFLEIYDEIWDFLGEEDILDKVIKEFNELLGKNSASVEKGSPMYVDVILEYGLFNYFHNGKILIDYVEENLIQELNQKQIEQFVRLKDSKRENLTFIKKEKMNQKDTYGRQMYFFSFKKENGKIVSVVSSAALDKNGKTTSMRLVKNPKYGENAYMAIGLIYHEKNIELMNQFERIKDLHKNINEGKERVNYLFKISRHMSEAEITSFKEDGKFIKQDRKLMLLNKKFYDKFKMDIQDFTANSFRLSNDKNKYAEMAKYYLELSDNFLETLYDTNYIPHLTEFSNPSFLRTFRAFIEEDTALLEKGIAELQKEAKNEFEAIKSNNIALSRDKIIENQKNNLKKAIAKLKKSGNSKKAEIFSNFYKEIETIPAEDIDVFLKKLKQFSLKEKYWQFFGTKGFNKEIFMGSLDVLSEMSGDLPGLHEIEVEFNEIVFNKEEFYNYYAGLDDDIYNLMIILYSAYLFSIREYAKAYDQIKDIKIKDSECFAQMFYMGKIHSFFGGKKYKEYFIKAKKMDKKRYKIELGAFLKWKEEVMHD